MHLTKEQLMREAMLLTFGDPVPVRCLQLLRVSDRSWQRLLYWLDVSGMALYFLDRLTQVGMCGLLPPSTLARLQQNLNDNTQRTHGMMAESIAIQQEFQSTGLSYAVLKGSSFWPHSVPRLELRSQLDLDFLIAEEAVSTGRRILESRGYHLHAVSGRSWEFKTTHLPSGSINNLYKEDVPWRSVELHVEPNKQGLRSQLAYIETRSFQGFQMPVLSPVDMFLGQGLHLYKHFCSEFSRAAHLLEFRRHVLSRRSDAAFWGEVRARAENDARASLGLGVVTQVITHIMGEFAPEALTSWTVDRLPVPASLWIEVYGRRSVFANFPGTKLYLLLQSELQPAGVPVRRTLRSSLIPRRLPPAISHASADDTLGTRMRRQLMQVKFILFRLHFHLKEGARYWLESRRWRSLLERFAHRETSRLNSSLQSTDTP